MNGQRLSNLLKSDYVKLVPILALAFYMAFIPHLNYPYAVHIDEWVHIAYSNSLLSTGTIFHPDPFAGVGSSGLVGLLELGYHLPFAVFYRISGISWMDISRYAPSIVFVFTVLSVYIFARRRGFGWEAAFFTCLIPTSVGIMGPAFMIPVAMALMFAVIVLHLAFNFKTIWSYPVICILISFLVILHATSAVLVILLLIPSIILGLRGDLKHSLWMILAVALPFIVTLPWTIGIISSQAGSLFIPKALPSNHDLPNILADYGYLPIIFCLFGTFVLCFKGDRKNYSLALGLLVLLAMLAVYYTFHYGLVVLWMRGLLFAMLMMSIVAGAGLKALRKMELATISDPGSKKPVIIKITGVLLCLLVIGAALVTTVPVRQNVTYYHMIDQADYEAFVWIRDNVDASQQKALLDPWKATAFTALTGKYVYTRIHTTTTAKDYKVYSFLYSGSTNTTFLRQNGISIVYTRVHYSEGPNNSTDINSDIKPDNPDLVKIRENVYLLKEAGTP